MLRKRVGAAALAMTAMITGGLVGVTATPAAAACDLISVGRPYHSGSHVKANSSICASPAWSGRSWIERYRGFYWDEVTHRNIFGLGQNIVAQFPLSWNCSGTGTYTYRGGIWAKTSIDFEKEHSATRRFRC